MKTKALIAFLFVLIAVSITQAQSAFCTTLDFTTGQHFFDHFDPGAGVFDSGFGWRDTDEQLSNGSWERAVRIGRQFTDTTLTSFTVTFDRNGGYWACGTCTAVGFFARDNGTNLVYRTWTFNQTIGGGGVSGTDVEIRVPQSGSAPFTADEIFLSIRSSLTNPPGSGGSMSQLSGSVLIKEIEICGEGDDPFEDPPPEGFELGDLIRPLTEDDTHDDWGIWDNAYAYSLEDSEDPTYMTGVFSYEDPESFDLLGWLLGGDEETPQLIGEFTTYAYSDAYGAYVYSSMGGRIEAILPLTPDNCTGFTEGLSLNTVSDIYIGALSIVRGYDCYVAIPKTVSGDFNDEIYRMNQDNAYIVSVLIGETGAAETEDWHKYYEYYVVANAWEYVDIGMEIGGGCILGETIQLQNLTDLSLNNASTGFEASFMSRSLGTQHGVSILQIYDIPFLTDTPETDLIPVPLSFYPLLTEEPVFEEACNVDPIYADCIGDASLSHPTQWQVTGNVSWRNPGVILDGGASIFQTLNLDDATEYTVTAIVERLNTSQPASFTVQLGTTIFDFDVPYNADSQTSNTIPLQLFVADNGLFYTLRVSNTSTNRIKLTTLCVTTTDTEQRGSCYLINHTFNQADAGWTLSAGAVPYPGEIKVPFDETIAQDLLLDPTNSGTEYTLTVTTRLDVSQFFDPLDYPTSGPLLEMAFDYGSQSGEVLQYMTAPDLSIFSITPGIDITRIALDGEQVWSTTLEISTLTDDALTIYPQLSMGSPEDAEFIGVYVTEVCLTGDFPDSTTGPPIEVNCLYIAQPTNNTIGAWIGWHWAKLNNFFQCELMILLNLMFDTIFKAAEIFAWSVKWTISVVNTGVDWLGDYFLPFLAGYLSNASGVTVYQTVETGPVQCEWYNLLCHLQGILGQLTPLIADLINRVVGPIIDTLLYILRGAIDLLLNVLNALIALALLFIVKIFEIFDFMQSLVLMLITGYVDSTPTSIPGLPDCAYDQTQAICHFYRLMEHTIFSGTGALILPIMGFVFVIHILIWAIDKLHKTFTGVGQLI